MQLETNAETDTQPLLGLAVHAKRSFQGLDHQPMLCELLARLGRNPDDAPALLDLSILLHLAGHREDALQMQTQALARQQHFRLNHVPTANTVRLLALMTPGDLTENNGLEFLVDGTDVQLELLYLLPNQPLPLLLPPHDVAMVAICESGRNLPALQRLQQYVRRWPAPLLNLPDNIALTARDIASLLVASQPGLVMPPTVRVNRDTLQLISKEAIRLDSILPAGTLPLIARPVDTHKGQGQAKLDSLDNVREYLTTRPEREFYLTSFVNYCSSDGQFRKYRVVLIDGRPYLSHLAISDHWMVHYMSSGMTTSAAKKAEEAYAMRTFERDFARRHQAAFATISDSLGLNYVGIDCGETQNGELLIFEFDAGMTVHSMDDQDQFPYKRPQMQKVFSAFRQMLVDAVPRREDFAVEQVA